MNSQDFYEGFRRMQNEPDTLDMDRLEHLHRFWEALERRRIALYPAGITAGIELLMDEIQTEMNPLVEKLHQSYLDEESRM